MSEPSPIVQPSPDQGATAIAVAYALYLRLPAAEQPKDPKAAAQLVGLMADIIAKRGVVPLVRT